MTDQAAAERRFRAYHKYVDKFVDKVLCVPAEGTTDDLYVPGTRRVDLGHLTRAERRTLAHIERLEDGDRRYEECLLDRLRIEGYDNVLVTVGGVGSGKTTSSHHITRKLVADWRKSTDESACACKACPSAPLYVNNNHTNRDPSYERVIQEILARVRHEALNRILDCWGKADEQNRIGSDDVHLIQNFLLLHPIRNWALAQSTVKFPTPPKTFPLKAIPAVHNFGPTFSATSIAFLRQAYSDSANTLIEYKESLAADLRDAVDLTACVLGYYASRLERTTRRSVVIVDNLDQLPTRQISEVLKVILRIAVLNPTTMFLVPLRPSSLAVEGYTQNVTYVYHEGPCCFRLIERRLLHFVLLRDRADILAERGKPHSPLSPQADSEEVNALIAACYIYFLMMKSGAGIPLTDIKQALSEIHPSHAQVLSRLDISTGPLESVSEALGALVGFSGRYALTHMSRFFKDMYYYPNVLIEATRSVQRGPVRVRVPYGRLIETLLLDRGTPRFSLGRCVNLFAPVISDLHPNTPSLTQLRILTFLEANSPQSVEAIVRHLALYGIPGDVCVRALNALHDPERRLLWFSDNHQLAVALDDVRRNEAVISEQGEGYLNSLLGNFDYLWACAASLFGAPRGLGNFAFRISQYVELIRQSFQVERRQIAFRLGAASELPLQEGVVRREIMLCLRVLYGSLADAATSARRAVESSDWFRAGAPDEGDYVGSIVKATVRLADLTQDAERHYVTFFGGPWFIDEYSSEIERAQEAIDALIHAERAALERHDRDSLVELITSWGNLHAAAKRYHGQAEPPPSSDLITRISEAGRNLVSKDALSTWDQLKEKELYSDQVIDALGAFRLALETRWPRYADFKQRAGALGELLAATFDACKRQGLATGTGYAGWCLEQVGWWNEIVEKLTRNEYDTRELTLDRADVDERKRRHNNLLGIYDEVARRLGARPAAATSFRVAAWR